MLSDFNQLVAELGSKSVITDPSAMALYLQDPIGARVKPPLAILRPDSSDKVAKAVKWCRRHHLPIVPQGGLTGLCSAAVPTEPGVSSVILSMSRLNRIRELDTRNNTITVEAGVVLADIRLAAEKAGRYFPLSHGGEGSSQIGGNLSTNSGGNNAVGYGTAQDQVLGLEVVLPDGTLWRGLRQLRKNTAGYDLKHLFIGAEGTLGLITAAVLKLRPYPQNRATAFVAVENPEKALTLLRDLETHIGETVSAFELLSRSAVSSALEIESARYPLDKMHAWNLLVEVETAARSFDLENALEAGLSEALQTDTILDAAIAQSTSQRDAFWHLRESIATVFVADKSSLKSDTAVPVSRVPEFISNTHKAVCALLPDARPAPFGHLGDGNIHFNVVRPATMSSEDFCVRWDDIAGVIEEQALKLGGTISAEHGIGRLKRDDFIRFSDSVETALMKKLRQALDLDGRMNSGVLF